MNSYKVTVKDNASLRTEVFYIAAPNYAAVESVVKKERYLKEIISIELQGECFVFSSLCLEQKEQAND